MDLRDKANDAHQIALELMKQIIALASGVVALSATFLEKLKPGAICLGLLGLSWAVLLASIFCGLQTISAIVKGRLDPDFEWSKGSGQTYARISKYAFVIDILLLATFTFLLLVRTDQSGDAHLQTSICKCTALPH